MCIHMKNKTEKQLIVYFFALKLNVFLFLYVDRFVLSLTIICSHCTRANVFI